MAKPQDHSDVLQDLRDRLVKREEAEADDLIADAMERLRRLARKMFSDRSHVRRWEQINDVLQNALIRLQRALKEIKRNSVNVFIGLPATQIRHELIDLARHHDGPGGTPPTMFRTPARLTHRGGRPPCKIKRLGSRGR